MLKKQKRNRQENVPERKDPGDPEPLPCSPGSIEQQLDMCEDGDLRGDMIEHRENPRESSSDESLSNELENYNVDMSEWDREGDELSGDEHSDGLEGGEPSLESQQQIESGLPGEGTEFEENERGKVKSS